jgi:hypothetical protein
MRRAYNLVRRTDLPHGGHFTHVVREVLSSLERDAFFRPYR